MWKSSPEVGHSHNSSSVSNSLEYGGAVPNLGALRRGILCLTQSLPPLRHSLLSRSIFSSYLNSKHFCQSVCSKAGPTGPFIQHNVLYVRRSGAPPLSPAPTRLTIGSGCSGSDEGVWTQPPVHRRQHTLSPNKNPGTGQQNRTVQALISSRPVSSRDLLTICETARQNFNLSLFVGLPHFCHRHAHSVFLARPSRDGPKLHEVLRRDTERFMAEPQ